MLFYKHVIQSYGGRHWFCDLWPLKMGAQLMQASLSLVCM